VMQAAGGDVVAAVVVAAIDQDTANAGARPGLSEIVLVAITPETLSGASPFHR